MRWIDRLFRLEEINGGQRCPTYLYRWTILKWRDRGLYLHHFVADDWSLDLHDHPKRFISIGLKGQYREERPTSQGIVWEDFKSPWVRTFPAEHRHRVSMINAGDCWTLVLVFKKVRPWGFWHEGRFIGWRDYVSSKTADEMKACSS